MVNTNIQGVVRLDGPGLRYKPLGDHGPGEYEMFQNVELIDGVIRTRRPIVPVREGLAYGAPYSPLPLGYSMNYFTGFAGHISNRAVATGINAMIQMGGAAGSKRMYGLFNPTSLPAPPGGHGTETDQTGHWVLGVFQYGGMVYYLTHKYEQEVVNELWLFYHDFDSANPDAQRSTIPPVGTNATKILTLSPGVGTVLPSYVKNRVFRGFFIHKDRLFILMNDRLYYSKATEPRVFASPDGGFIDTDSGIFYDAVALSDNIYLSSEMKTYAFSYSTDPAKDGYLRPIYEGSKITKMVIHNDIMYAASQTHLYRVVNFDFEPIFEFDQVIKRYDQRTFTIKMEAFGDSIVIGQGFYSNYDTRNGKWLVENYLRNVLFYNVDSDSVSQIYFKDGEDPVSSYEGNICDFTVNHETEVLYFALMSNSGTARSFRFYAMNVSRDDFGADFNEWDHPTSTSGLDVVYDKYGLDSVAKTRIKVNVGIKNWMPEGSPYVLKKFRYLRVNGYLPYEVPLWVPIPDFYVDLYVGEKAYFHWSSQEIQPNEEENLDNNPMAYMLRVNQKGTRIRGLYLYNSLNYNNDSFTPDNANTLFLSIQDIRFYYTMTQFQGNNAVVDWSA